MAVSAFFRYKDMIITEFMQNIVPYLLFTVSVAVCTFCILSTKWFSNICRWRILNRNYEKWTEKKKKNKIREKRSKSKAIVLGLKNSGKISLAKEIFISCAHNEPITIKYLSNQYSTIHQYTLHTEKKIINISDIVHSTDDIYEDWKNYTKLDITDTNLIIYVINYSMTNALYHNATVLEQLLEDPSLAKIKVLLVVRYTLKKDKPDMEHVKKYFKPYLSPRKVEAIEFHDTLKNPHEKIPLFKLCDANNIEGVVEYLTSLEEIPFNISALKIIDKVIEMV